MSEEARRTLRYVEPLSEARTKLADFFQQPAAGLLIHSTVKETDMEAWRRILADSIVKPKDLAARLGVDAKEIEAIVGDYPMRITPTVMATISSIPTTPRLRPINISRMKRGRRNP